jgi:chitodextrinase
MTFNGTYTGQPAPTTWTWNFGDNTAGSGQIAVDDYNAAHASPGITVTLTIKSAACPAASVSHQVVVP